MRVRVVVYLSSVTNKIDSLLNVGTLTLSSTKDV